MAALRGTLFICAAVTAVTAVTGVRVAPTTATVAPRRQVLAGLAAAAALESGAAAAAEQKTYLVTGASSGIGFAAASELARRGHRVALACRTVESAAATAARLPGAALWTPQKAGCALDDLGAVAAFADEVSTLGRLDGALLVAGVDGAPRAADGADPHFRINYLSHALLARRMLPQLRKSRGRVVTVASEALLDSDLSLGKLDGETLVNQRGAAPHVAYANSKACCVLLADALKAREPALAVAACALPGRCATQIVRYELPQRAAQRRTMTDDQIARQAKQLGLRTAAQGAALPVWLADAPEARTADTLWLDPGVPARLAVPWRSPEAASKLWDVTSGLLAQV